MTHEIDDHRPKLDKDGFDCPRCAAYAKQEWGRLFGEGENYGYYYTDMNLGLFDEDAHPIWRTARCARCGEASVWRGEQMMYPHAGLAPLPHVDMPDDAKALYEEARSVLGVSRRAGTALARAALERLLRKLHPQTGNPNLATRIESIFPKVPVPLGQMLTVIRVAGNASLHVADTPDDVQVLVLDPEETEIVELMFDAINVLVEELITKPRQMEGYYNKLPEAIRERVDVALRSDSPA